MKLITIATCIALLPFFCGNVSSQVPWCATDNVYREYQKQNPAINILHRQSENGFVQWLKNNVQMLKQQSAAPVITIPVVFHIVYHVDSPQQNIPDAAIFSQMDVINRDFRRLNGDTDDVRVIFDSLQADIQFEFCLASVDPSGNQTTGIVRTAATVGAWDFYNNDQDSMKFSIAGGDDAWPKDSYLNIWTANMTFFGYGGILGFSHFPWDTNSATDGIVLQYNAVGNPSYPYGMPPGNGRPLTHEIGHWFGLFHTWGNESFFPGCDSSDYVDDTPNQNGQSNNDCSQSANTCANESPFWGAVNPPDMVENHLDYSSDTCRCMFSKGQKSRMFYYLYNYRSSLFNAVVCDTSTGIMGGDGEAYLVTVSPNPMQNVARITIAGGVREIGEIREISRSSVIFRLTDVFGRNIEILHTSKLPVTLFLQRNGLLAGIYFYEVSVNGMNVYTGKLVIN
ncbi:MAG: zinc metalloprotease [Bacteroidetes bacterium]|nr:zinc metalloprotease [Bacteroidota bacterium]